MKKNKTEEELEKMKAEADAMIQKAMASSAVMSGLAFKPNKVKVGIFVEGAPKLIPEYKTLGASGMDVRANIKEPITLKPLERVLVPTGIYVDIPDDYEFQLRPRSGLSWKRGLTLINCIGTIDDDYIGLIQVPLVNISNEEQTIQPNERIAQLVLMKVEKVEWEHHDSTSKFNSKNRMGGFGSTGKH